MDFLIELNNKSISSKYDSDYFNEVLEMIKNNYQASDARFISEALKKEDEVIIDLPTDDSIKLLIKGNKVSIDNKELLVSILGNMFKNKKIIEKLEEDKYTDSLLKIRNRIAYDEILNKKCLYNNLGVAFVDANGLGIINNMYGYKMGNELLKTVTESLVNNFKQTYIYRIGGDELVVICSDITKELFYERIASSRIFLEDTPFGASFGVVYTDKTDDLDGVIDLASIKMKKAKEKYREEHPEEYLDKYKVKYKEKAI